MAVVATIPTQLALVFFGLLHVPINLPSLAISIGEDNVDTDKELLSHGIANIASGLVGSVPNYLCKRLSHLVGPLNWSDTASLRRLREPSRASSQHFTLNVIANCVSFPRSTRYSSTK